MILTLLGVVVDLAVRMLPKLTIAIPTYNGAKYISDALNSILLQLPSNHVNEREVDILVCDNASVDETEQIIRRYQEDHDFIEYYRNQQTLHADYNFDLAVRKSKGEYVWLLSDDDVIELGAIKKVLSILCKFKGIGAVFPNFSQYNSDLSQCIKNKALDLTSDLSCISKDEYFLATEFKTSIVSTVIIKRKLWEGIDTSKYMKTCWVHFGVLFEILSKHPGYVISYPILKVRCIESRWETRDNLEAPLNLHRIFKSLPDLGYREATTKRAARGLKNLFTKAMIVQKKNGVTFDRKLLMKCLRAYKSYPLFWLIDLPLICSPSSFHRIIYLAHRRLSNCFHSGSSS